MSKIVLNGETFDLSPAPILEEYDTTVDDCNWHVRKWSNGYVEMTGSKVYKNLPVEQKWGELFDISNDYIIGRVTYPIPLVIKYRDDCSIEYAIAIDNTAYAAGIIVQEERKEDLSHSKRVNIFRATAANSMTFKLALYTTGRWK